ncbi:transglutaminase domain-containing protein [Candidatus Collierbacteria bacterium]|nr:transglutaminase domain-containing protein [Candidatus Collierbacteria bacterium]
MFRLLFAVFVYSIFTILLTRPAQGISQFSTSYSLNYAVKDDGSTHVLFDIAQKNNLSAVFATSFSLSLSHTDVRNLLIKDSSGTIIPQIEKTDNLTNISFDFLAKVVGKNKINRFTVEYDTVDVASRNGSVWEINIPKLETPEDVSDFNIILTVPDSFKDLAFVNPKPSKVQGQTYFFNFASLGNRSISALFGSTQYYKLKLYYNLKNTQLDSATTQIAIPPDTAYQQVLIDQVKPIPIDLKADPDGNWLLSYNLPPNSDLQVIVDLNIKLNFKPKSQPLDNPEIYLRPTKTWDFENTLFDQDKFTLKTPREIYDFVVGYLAYDYTRLTQEGPSRPGAVFALTNPQNSICTEFTDLFIALARKNGIPAREVQGFALSNNDHLKPLSLTKDVLHAWPEYYDSNLKTWIQVDPTWANTTGGIDYFSKLDLNHIAFVVHGLDSLNPLPAGAYKTANSESKDVYVEVTDEFLLPKPQLDIIFSKVTDDRVYFLAKNSSPVSISTSLSAYPSKLTSLFTYDLNLPPFSEERFEIPIASRVNLAPVKFEIIIDAYGQNFRFPVNLTSRFGTSFYILTGGVILAGISLPTWYLYLRRQRPKPPIHWKVY